MAAINGLISVHSRRPLERRAALDDDARRHRRAGRRRAVRRGRDDLRAPRIRRAERTRPPTIRDPIRTRSRRRAEAGQGGAARRASESRASSAPEQAAAALHRGRRGGAERVRLATSGSSTCSERSICDSNYREAIGFTSLLYGRNRSRIWKGHRVGAAVQRRQEWLAKANLGRLRPRLQPRRPAACTAAGRPAPNGSPATRRPDNFTRRTIKFTWRSKQSCLNTAVPSGRFGSLKVWVIGVHVSVACDRPGLPHRAIDLDSR
jgi:hypothetical protein